MDEAFGLDVIGKERPDLVQGSLGDTAQLLLVLLSKSTGLIGQAAESMAAATSRCP
ncbi:hypothetical protein [Brevibacterium antiquum]|uniref:Uncharacterized protein n=1 Tax=Brevibacterium antiquum TaxID=234835 RepID=A0A2H1JWH0_9MICO|nr:hypothetical protein [Brevibacterium antiquum]SMX91885.1 hypothetical protein BANT10_02448 [Brevibacterium antiquum]